MIEKNSANEARRDIEPNPCSSPSVVQGPSGGAERGPRVFRGKGAPRTLEGWSDARYVYAFASPAPGQNPLGYLPPRLGSRPTRNPGMGRVARSRRPTYRARPGRVSHR